MSDSVLPPGYADTDIAVVGMAARFPGAQDVHQFWENVRNGVDASVELDEDELRASGATEDQLRDPEYVRKAYAVEDMAGFDAGFFGFSPREAAIMDPQQRHFLELAWSALEDAGYDPARLPGSAGVFAGCGASLYLMRNLLTNPDLVENVGFFLLRHTGNDKDFLATRVSYLMNLHGPSVNVQTACSTSLVAIHLAVQSLLSNECGVALAGGSTLRQPHRTGYQYVEGEIMSPDGKCRTFDADAEGTVFGSGAGVVVLRRLEDALADGDTIHAVIKASAINNDGSQKVGYLAPSVEAQALNLAEALALSGVDPAQLGYIECHGTATPVGDPIEVVAMTQALANSEAPQGSIAIGSVKTGIGHLDTAAGVAGFIKMVQSLKHGVLPPSLHFQEPNPALDLESSPFFVNTETRPWPDDREGRFAAVSALGAGGTNAHVVLQEAPPVAPEAPSAQAGYQLLPLSAKTPSALDARADQLVHALRAAHPSLEDMAYTLQMGRQALGHRRFAVAAHRDEAAELLESRDPKRAPSQETPDVRRSVVFTFAGGGAQYPGMGQDLYENLDAYRAAVDECAALIQPELDFDLKGLLYPAVAEREAAATEMERPSRSLPCLFTTQYAVARQLMAWGIEPDAMLGHSMGEYTAAHLAGVFSLKDALRLVTVRGKLFETVPRGGMLSVPLAAEELQKRLPPELSVAAANAPELSVASGPVEALDALEAALLAEDIECSRIRIEVAAHSSMLESILDEFGRFTAAIRFAEPERPFISNVSGTWITPEQATDPDYWVRHLRQTVRFAEGAGVVLEDEGRILLDVGPGRIMTTLASLHDAKKATHGFLTTLRHPEEEVDDRVVTLGAVGHLWALGLEVDWEKLHDGARRRVPLPTYPFEHREYFIEPGEITAPAPSLARRADPGAWLWRPSWRRETLRPTSVDGLADERWAVLLDPDGVGHGLADALESLGAAVIRVQRGPGFSRQGETGFTVNPGQPEDFERLVGALGEDIPGRWVHTWAAANGPVDEDRAFHSLVSLAQAWGREGVDDELRLDVVTTGGHYVGSESRIEPDRALVQGPVRVIPKEFENVHARSVDLPHPAAPGWFPNRAVEQLLRELATEGDETTVAWRGVERYVQDFEEVHLEEGEAETLAVRDGSTWLITGGTGGLGLVMAQELAAKAKVKLALVSRRGEAGPEVRALEALGSEVAVLKGDVTDEAGMRRVVEEVHARFGPIHGIIHAAGLIEDNLILMKEPESAARVLAPKVRGTRVLDAVTAGEPLEWLVYFSSRGAFAGVVGQVDYASASAYLDAFAQKRAQVDGVRAVSINWSAWQGVGIAAAAGEGPGRPANHPIFERCTREDADALEYRSTLSPESHWLLDGHRLRSGEALIPGTGYVELMGAALEERGALPGFELRDLFFLSPFQVADDGRRELRVRAERDGDEWEVVVEGRPNPGSGSWEEHARGAAQETAARTESVELASIRDRVALRRTTFQEDQQRNANLTLGHRWSNLLHIDYGETEALAELRLPEDVRAEVSDFRLHPALLDVACACAQELVPGFDTSKIFYVPVSYGRVTVLDRLPAHVLSHVRLQPGAGPDADTAVYDITITDLDGRVVVDIADFTMFRVKEGSGVGGSSVTTRAGAGEQEPTLLQFEGALRPEEGLDVFRRILASGLPGQWIVSPQHLKAYLAALLEPEEEEAPAAGGAERPVLDLVDASDVEAALADHEAVDEVVVLAHRTPEGQIRATAFVVWELGEEITIAEAKRHLAGKVDEALMPEQIIEMEEFPRDSDGEVIRSELPDPFAPKDSFVAPSTETEKVVAEIWKDLLGVSRISADDNFLDVGGHSLLAMRAISKIAKATGVRLNPSVMTLNTLRQIAAEAEAKRAAS